MPQPLANQDDWPALPLDAWQDTYTTLHLWTQVVGKVRQHLCPPLNHWWSVTLYVTSRGLTTGRMPHGFTAVQIDMDFISHELLVTTSRGDRRSLPLRPTCVAQFYEEVMAALRELGAPVEIHTLPQEVPDPVPFPVDRAHCAYDPEYANRFWRALVQADRVLQEFRSWFIGKASPVHYFWGACDLAVTRFSGRPAPEHPTVPSLSTRVVREAYSHEVSSCGWWPGGGPAGYPAFYSYAYPEPPGFRDAPAQPDAAFYSADLGEFILPYDSVRRSPDPDQTLLGFLQSTYEAAANLGRWDRAALERQSP